jgi:hypothetical protein
LDATQLGETWPLAQDQSRRAPAWQNHHRGVQRRAGSHAAALGRFPITWNHVIEKESLNINKLEHVGIEKVEQLF